MFVNKANIVTTTIDKNDSSFSLKGMIQPNFQNQGCDVLINGWKVATGEAFPINLIGLELQNSISIQFTAEANRKLVLAYGQLVD